MVFRKLVAVLVAAQTAVFASPGMAANGAVGWVLLQGSLQTPRAAGVAEFVNGRLVVAGGWNSHSGTVGLKSVEMYDRETGTWVRLADMIVPHYYCASAVMGPYLYVFGGLSNRDVETRICERYDLETNTWTRIADMPRNRHSGGAAVWLGRILLFGGRDGSTTPMLDVDVYDPYTDTWTVEPVTRVPGEILVPRAITIGKKIYLAGASQANLWSYEPDKKDGSKWDTSLPGPSIIRGAHAVVGANSRVYVIGGRTAANVTLTSVESWAPGEPSWRTEPSLVVGRDHLQAASEDGFIYAVGGLNAPNGAYLGSAEKLPPNANADFDDDGDVDSEDFSIFAACFNGPNRSPACPW